MCVGGGLISMPQHSGSRKRRKFTCPVRREGEAVQRGILQKKTKQANILSRSGAVSQSAGINLCFVILVQSFWNGREYGRVCFSFQLSSHATQAAADLPCHVGAIKNSPGPARPALPPSECQRNHKLCGRTPRCLRAPLERFARTRTGHDGVPAMGPR